MALYGLTGTISWAGTVYKPAFWSGLALPPMALVVCLALNGLKMALNGLEITPNGPNWL